MCVSQRSRRPFFPTLNRGQRATPPFPVVADVSQFRKSLRPMDETSKVFAPELAPLESRKWIARLVIAIVLGAAIWNFLVAITEYLVLPAMARLLEVDPQSPLYLGKGDFGAPALFTAVVELCFAVIVAAVLSSLIQRPLRTVRIVRRAPAVPLSAQAFSDTAAPPRPTLSQARPAAEPPAPAPTSLAASAAMASQPAASVSEPSGGQPTPGAQPPAQPVKPDKPAKPKPPKEVYYNLVGEPIDSDED